MSLKLIIFSSFLSISSTFSNDLNAQVKESQIDSRPWLSEIFAEAEENFKIHDGASERCREDIEKYQIYSENNTIWAIRMFESSEWPKLGLFQGKTDHWGNFDECLMISSAGIEGKYCTIEAQYTILNESDEASLVSLNMSNPTSNAWYVLQSYQKDVTRWDRSKLRWSICIPSSCSNIDVEESLHKTVLPIFNKYDLNLTVRVGREQCRVAKTNPSSIVNYIKNIIIYTVIMVIAATILELYSGWNIPVTQNGFEECNLYRRIVISFSLKRNYKSLTDVNNIGDHIPFLSLQKVLISILLIRHYRRLLLSLQMFDASNYEQMVYRVFLTPQYLMTSIFFFSGFSFCLYKLQAIKNGYYSFSEMIIQRWFRLVPLMVLGTSFALYLIPFISDSPLMYLEDRKREQWRKHFWKYTFGMTLIANPEKSFYAPFLYLICDFRLSILSFILLQLFVHKRKYAFLIMFGLNIFSTYFTSKMQAIDSQSPIPDLREMFLNNDEPHYYSIILTFAQYIPVYIFGITVAMLALIFKQIEFNFPKGWIIKVFISFQLLAIALTCYVCTTNSACSTCSAIKLVLCHIFRILPLAFIHLVNVVNGDEVISNYVPRFIVTLARLSHSVNVISWLVVKNSILSHRTLITITDFNVFTFHLVDPIYSYIGAFILYLTIEAPFRNLAKIFLHTFKRKTPELNKTE